jgi:two-component system chemotaxis response regulator CheV
MLMAAIQKSVSESSNLTGTNQFELLLFRLGTDGALGQSELFGINVLKVREIVTMPTITPIVGASKYSLGVVHLRDQVIPVYDLPKAVNCKLEKAPTLMLVTEYSRTIQAFTLDSVEDIVRLDWNQVESAEGSGSTQTLVSSIARIDDGKGGTQLVQVLDVEAILQMIAPKKTEDQVNEQKVGPKVQLRPGTIILVADDSYVARALMEKTLQTLQVPCEVVKSGLEAWNRLNVLTDAAQAEGKTILDKVSLMLTDLEMPEMDGFTLTRNIKQDRRMSALPVIIHSSLTGSANENHVRSVGADGYVAKFSAEELSDTIRRVLR